MALKILLLNNRVPFPLRDGGARATYTLVESLVQQGAEVSVVFLNTQKHFVDEVTVKRTFSFLKHIKLLDIDTSISIFGALGSFFKGSSYNVDRFFTDDVAVSLADFLTKNSFDIIHFENLFMAPYLQVVRQNSDALCVLRMHNVEHQIWEKLAENESGFLKRRYLNYLSKKLKEYETAALPLFDAVLPISKVDEQWAHGLTSKPIHYLPAGFYFNKKENTPQIGNNFFHIGSMEWQPNVQACEWLVKDIWPLVVAKNPNLQLHLAGKGMGQEFDHWKTENIHIHGEVADAEGFMKDYDCMLIPLQSASGVRMKAIEAMQFKKPIIATSIGMSGLMAINKENCLLAETKEQFAAAILLLANDKIMYHQLAENGYSYVIQNFEARTIAQQLLHFYHQLIK